LDKGAACRRNWSSVKKNPTACPKRDSERGPPEHIEPDVLKRSSAAANDQTWTYRYERADAQEGLNYYYLSEVVRPDGLRWRYRYYPFNSAQGAAGKFSMQSVKYPYGANISYDAMNRLTGIIYPRNAPVGIIWDGSGKTLTRGNY
jgi:hypothetical protein